MKGWLKNFCHQNRKNTSALADMHLQTAQLTIVGKRAKEEGLDNDMIERICADSTLDIAPDEIKEILIPSKYIGRCIEQVERFLKNDVDPFLEGMDSAIRSELSV